MKLHSFADFITETHLLDEGYQNFIGVSSETDRRKWIDRAYALLETAYAKIGGLAGSGFSSKEDVITQIPFWKLYIRNDRLMMVAFYKDSGGRKLVAIATDGSSAAKEILIKTMRADLGVAYGEFSKAALITFLRANRFEDIKHFIFTPEQVAKITGKMVHPVTPELLVQFDSSDQTLYARYKELLGDYFYAREIGGALHMKVALGTPQLPIIS